MLIHQQRFKASDPRTSITSLDFDDSGELALLARDDETLQIYNCKEGKHAKELKSQKYGVHLARFSHYSQSIIYASTKVDDTIRFLSVHDNSFIRYFRGHTDLVTSISLCPSGDSFLSCSRDNTVLLWDLRSPNYQGKLAMRTPYLAAYDPAALVIAVASPETHYILMYDIRNYDQGPFAEWHLESIERKYMPEGGAWTKLEFTNDNTHLVLSTAGKGHFVIDAFDGSLVFFARRDGHTGRLAPEQSPPDKSSRGLDGKSAQGQGDTALSPDGQYILGGSSQNGVHIWDISKKSDPSSIPNKTIDPVETLPCKSKAPIVGYNPRVNLLVSGDRDLSFWQPDLELVP